MIGLGTWQCSVKTMFFTGDVEITISDNNGEYGFELKIPGVDVPPLDVKDIKEEGNNLTATATTEMFPGKEAVISADFDGDTVSGFAKLPFIGKVKFKDGKKIG